MILIIGAGIAGLSLGWELLKAGADVTLVEAGSIASGASGVATSYLEPRLGETAMRKLEWQAFRKWPTWSSELEEASGTKVNFCSKGQLKVTLAENLTRFEKDIDQRTTQHWSFEELSAGQVRELEPSLSSELIKGLFLPDMSWVDGLEVCYALASAITRLGGEIRMGWHVDRVEFSGRSARLIARDGNILEGETIVLANGIGANTIEGIPDDIPPSRPIRGVNLIIDQTPLDSPITHLIKHHRGNLCPRGDNRLIVGTTYDRNETNLVADDSVIEKLYNNTEGILPALPDLPLLDVTCGVRVKIGDGKLLLGRSELEPRLGFSLSHAGAGFLRAPTVAQEFARYLIDGQTSEFFAPFINRRF